MGLINLAIAGALIVAGVLVITGQLTDIGDVALEVVAGILALLIGLFMVLGKMEGGLVIGVLAIVAGVLILLGNFPFMDELQEYLNWIVGGGLVILGVLRLVKK